MMLLFLVLFWPLTDVCEWRSISMASMLQIQSHERMWLREAQFMCGTRTVRVSTLLSQRDCTRNVLRGSHKKWTVVVVTFPLRPKIYAAFYDPKGENINECTSGRLVAVAA